MGKLHELLTFVRSRILPQIQRPDRVGNSRIWREKLWIGGRSCKPVERRVSGLRFAIRSANSPIASGGDLGNDRVRVLGTKLVQRAPERSFSGRCAGHPYKNHFCNNATLNYTSFSKRT
jgi:hypothetical protein